MKCKIFISKNSNNLNSCAAIKNAIIAPADCVFETQRNITVYFNKKREAQAALKNAFIQLQSEEPLYFGVRHSRNTLHYDAALATIENCS